MWIIIQKFNVLQILTNRLIVICLFFCNIIRFYILIREILSAGSFFDKVIHQTGHACHVFFHCFVKLPCGLLVLGLIRHITVNSGN